MELTAGRVLAERFALEAPAEHVGLGEGWNARDVVDNDRCVIKPLRRGADLRALDPYRRLRGTRIVALRAAGLDGDLPWAAYDVAEGQPLSACLEAARAAGRRFELTEVRSLALALCGSVGTAHRVSEAAMATHGALTPVSVHVRSLTARECELAVGDFGLLPMLFQPSWSPPKVGEIAWFPIAPESDGTSKRVTPATDVFATALIVAEMLAVAPARAALWAAISQDERALPAVIERLRPGLHASVREVLVGALRLDPARRPRDADRLARALRDASWEESAVVPQERPSAAPARPVSPSPAQAPTPTRARIAEAWSAPAVTPSVAVRENGLAVPVAQRSRAVTAPIERGFGPRELPHAEPHTLVTKPVVPSGVADGEDTIQSVPPVALAALFAEPDTVLVPPPQAPHADGERTQPLPPEFATQEQTQPLSQVPLVPVAPAPSTAADEQTIGLDVLHSNFGNGAPIPVYAQGDAGTMVVLPAAAAAWIHVAEQQRTNPVPDFQETAPIGANAIQKAIAASNPVARPSKEPTRTQSTPSQVSSSQTERPMPAWIPWAVLGSAVVLAVVVFFVLTRG